DVVREMEQIAKKRKITAKSGYLLLGSFFNPPTREGIFEFLEQYATQIADLKKPIFVGGFGSSPYQEEIENRGVKFVGEVTKDQLQELYETTSGAICYQTWGSGALTRISEYLNASIPVYANDFACRSYRRQVGIKPIENLFEDHKSQIDAVSED
ncbi:MAG: hypothetical protein KI791_14795, partial [Cyclobacteriaceae bacterium]|nr:hypothetical protein [Cyclobacteriaceae bacterium SS2]